MQLSPAAIRVLGALVEKSLATPQQYPLTLNALVSACNQSSAREPVTDLSDNEVQHALRELREHDLSRTAALRSRTPRYQHLLDEQLGIDEGAVTALGVLMLRGPQTVGEVRTRTTRWTDALPSLEDAERTLTALAEHHLLPLVAELPREPGRRESRWTHLLGDGDLPEPATQVPTAVPAPATSAQAPSGPATPAPTSPAPTSPGPTSPSIPSPDRVAQLEDRVSALEQQVRALHTLVGQLGDGGEA